MDRINGSLTEHNPLRQKKQRHQFFWLWVMCLLGLDYFSTLAYQPSITYEVAGPLGPVATAGVVLLTLLGALPVYWYLAARSPSGQGSLGMLETMVRGWRGKTLILVLLGFAATDFTMLKTLSLADAAVHVLVPHHFTRHPVLHQVGQQFREWLRPVLGEGYNHYFTEQMVVTVLLGLLGFLFWFVLREGFTRKVLYVAVPLIAIYLLLNGLLIGAGIALLIQRPSILQSWMDQIHLGQWGLGRPSWQDGWGQAGLVSLLFLPNLALGLSGFELNMILMPQVAGRPGDTEKYPRGRIANTRLVLLTAAVIMSCMLLGAVTITTLLIPPAEYVEGGTAVNRALAYLAHGGELTTGNQLLLPLCGPALGLFYDIITVLILTLAGTSVMTALATLIPHFLSRFGMEIHWVRRWGGLMLLFAAINFAVTVFFQASVKDQRGAYATGVLVLLSSAALIAFVDIKRLRRSTPQKGLRRLTGWLEQSYFGLVALIFLVILLVVLVRSVSGVLIGLCFITLILGMSVLSRAVRANEKRTIGIGFVDDQSRFLWESLVAADFPILIPHRPGRESARVKVQTIRREHDIGLEIDLVILEVEVDDPSNFYQTLRIQVVQEDNHHVIKVTDCCSVPHAIATIALEMSRTSKPPGVHFGWSEIDPLTASWNYLAFGEGNIPWKVRELIQQMQPDPARRPRVIVG